MLLLRPENLLLVEALLLMKVLLLSLLLLDPLLLLKGEVLLRWPEDGRRSDPWRSWRPRRRRNVRHRYFARAVYPTETQTTRSRE
jgi:hypothetical protein